MADPAILWSYLFAAQPVVRVTISATAEDLTIATGTTAPKTITEIAALLQTALSGHTAGPSLTVSITSGFRLQIVSDLAVQLNFSHANTTIDPVILGFTTADTASQTTLTSPNQPGGLWRPGKPAEEDTGNVSRVVGGVSTALSGKQRVSYFGSPYAERDLVFGLLLPAVAETRFATTTEPKGTLEAAWLESLSKGYPFRLAEDETDLTTYTEYVIREPTARPVSRDERFPAQRYRGEIKARRTA